MDKLSIDDASHPFRVIAIRIIEELPLLTNLQGEKYYLTEDKIVDILNSELYRCPFHTEICTENHGV